MNVGHFSVFSFFIHKFIGIEFANTQVGNLFKYCGCFIRKSDGMYQKLEFQKNDIQFWTLLI